MEGVIKTGADIYMKRRTETNTHGSERSERSERRERGERRVEFPVKTYSE